MVGTLGGEQVRNVFDQYSQPENRVTHAFLTGLNEDRRLLDGFLRELFKVTPPVSAHLLRSDDGLPVRHRRDTSISGHFQFRAPSHDIVAQHHQAAML